MKKKILALTALAAFLLVGIAMASEYEDMLEYALRSHLTVKTFHCATVNSVVTCSVTAEAEAHWEVQDSVAAALEEVLGGWSIRLHVRVTKPESSRLIGTIQAERDAFGVLQSELVAAPQPITPGSGPSRSRGHSAPFGMVCTADGVNCYLWGF